MDIRISRDFERSGEYRQLQRVYGDQVAAWLWMRLYVDLAHAVRSTKRLAWLSEELLVTLRESLGAEGAEGMVAALKEVGLLVRDESGGWHCPKFAEDNPQLEPGHKSIQSAGGHSRAFVLAQKRLVEELPMQTLLLPNELFMRPETNPPEQMNPAEVRRVTMIIRSVDNALKLPQRATATYTPALIADAWRMHEAFTDAQIQEGCMVLVRHRDHPALPKQTEQVLPRFKELVGRLASGR